MLREEFEDTRIRKSKKDRQHDGKKKRTKGQTTMYKHTHKTEDLVTRTPLKTGVELGRPGKISSSCSTSTQFLRLCVKY